VHTLAHISDVHFGREDPPVVEGLLQDLQGRAPTLTVVSGDFTQRARPSQYRRAAEFLAKLPKPHLVVPGNHDIPLWNVVARAFWPLRNYKRFITPDTRPTFEAPGLWVMGVNTARRIAWTRHGFWKDGHVSAGQLTDIRARSVAQPPGTVRVLAAGRPAARDHRRRQAGDRQARRRRHRSVAGRPSAPRVRG
jgi:3',5'-cyclic AMP phosphodiesterase CpdA